MKKYVRLFKNGILNSSAFKMDFYFGFITIPIQVIISWYFWKYANLENVGRGFTLNSIVLYFLIVNILSIIYSPAMYVCYESMELINSGNIITWMTRPIDIRLLKLFEKLGNFFVISIVPIALYIGLAIFTKSITLYVAFLGIVSTFFGFTILFFVQLIIGFLSFWFNQVLTFRDMIFDIMWMLGGIVLPIDFFPEILRNISLWSPLSYSYYIPAKIMAGIMPAENILKYLILQIVWILGLYMLSGLIYKKGKNKTVQGG